MAATALPATTAPTASTPKLLVRCLPRHHRRPLLPLVAALDLDGGLGVVRDRRVGACRGISRNCCGMTTTGDNSPSPHNHIVAGMGGRRRDCDASISRKRRNMSSQVIIVEGKNVTTPSGGIRGTSSHRWKSVSSRWSPPFRCGPRLPPPRARPDRSLFLPAGRISLTRGHLPVDYSNSSAMAGMGIIPIRILPPRLWCTSIGRSSLMDTIGIANRRGSSSLGHVCREVVSLGPIRLRAFASSTGSGGGGVGADPAPPPRSGDDEPKGAHQGSNDMTDDGLEGGRTPTTTAALTLVDRLPQPVQPYARLIRLDKPWGSMLLLWPCLWSTALAAPPGCPPDPTLCVLFATGAFVMRGAGCVINDLWDADFDRRVERTKSRPLASGELTERRAVVFLTTQLALGLGVLVSLPHAGYCFKLGMASMPLVVAYPLMKRYTNWPQLVLGMTFNWGALMGWAAVHGSLDWSVVGPLYGSGIAWTLVYDTLYAHQDKVDDAKLGLKSTALHFGDDGTKPILYGFSCLSLAGWTAAGYHADLVSPEAFYAGCAAAFGHLVWQIRTADLDDPDNLARRFRSNQVMGGIVFASCVAGNVGISVGT